MPAPRSDVVAGGAAQWERVRSAVRRRRTIELGIGQQDVAARGGVSLSTVSLVERAAQTSYQRRKLAGVSRGLGWPVDAIERILRGELAVEDDGRVRDVLTSPEASSEDETVVRLRGKVDRLSEEDARTIEALVDRLLAERE